MFDHPRSSRRSVRDDQAPAGGAPVPGIDHERTAYVRAAVDGYGTALGEIVAQLGPESVSSTRWPELWDAFDRLERLAAAGKTVLAHRAA
jgi:hypothetical protein